jgi:surface antigen
MKTFLFPLSLILMLVLSACSNNPLSQLNLSLPQTSDNLLTKAPTSPLPGSSAMDAIDTNKLFHALDNAPGKSTTWTNANTGITYTAVPVKKVVVNNNPFCRAYTLTILKAGNQNQINGTACVNTDGKWTPIN